MNKRMTLMNTILQFLKIRSRKCGVPSLGQFHIPSHKLLPSSSIHRHLNFSEVTHLPRFARFKD